MVQVGFAVNTFWENPYIETAAFYSVAIVSLLLSLAVFELATRYRNWHEIKNGNMAVALATGGKIFGIANVFHYSIAHNDTMWEALVWSIYGFVLLLVAYFLFEFLTPAFKVDEEIQNDNRAVGLVSMVISVSLSFVIGASIR